MYTNHSIFTLILGQKFERHPGMYILCSRCLTWLSCLPKKTVFLKPFWCDVASLLFELQKFVSFSNPTELFAKSIDSCPCGVTWLHFVCSRCPINFYQSSRRVRGVFSRFCYFKCAVLTVLHMHVDVLFLFCFGCLLPPCHVTKFLRQLQIWHDFS